MRVVCFSPISTVSPLNTCSNDFIHRPIECEMLCKCIACGTAVRGEGGVAGEEKLVGVPKFHSWNKCTMPLTNIQSEWLLFS